MHGGARHEHDRHADRREHPPHRWRDRCIETRRQRAKPPPARHRLAAEASGDDATHGDEHPRAMWCHIADDSANNIARVVVPGGVMSYRIALRRRGGLFAAGGAAVTALAGLILIVAPGRLTGLVGFALVVAACPLLVAFGVPLASGTGAIVGGVAASLALWFAIGQFAAHRATREAIADWRDWFSIVWPLATAMVLGGGGGFVLFALGVL